MSKRKLLLKLPKTHFLAATAAGLMIGGALIFSPSEQAEANRISMNLPIDGVQSSESPTLAMVTPAEQKAASSLQSEDELTAEELVSIETPAETAPVTSNSRLSWHAYQVQSGDSFSTLFKRAGVPPNVLAKMVQELPGKDWTQLYPGEEIEFGFDDETFHTMRIHRNRLENWLITESDEGSFTLDKVLAEPEVQTSYAEGTINTALFIDAKKAGLSDQLIMEFANIFGWDIDFILDIREGDSFKLVYEELYFEGEKIGIGNILAAQFVNQGKVYNAVRYEDKAGKVSYFTPEGESMKKTFLRSPIDFARVSSHFNLSRKHPVLHTIRAHKGTDYAAGRGTPIKATGDGKVIFAGRKGGYGNVVILQHGQSITTLYAHMKGFARGIRSGKRISQGQVIGYVGSSGLATGPHLHFEFRVNGVHKNPVTVKLPKAQPVAKSELEAFKKHAEIAMAQLESYANSYQVASSKGVSSAEQDL
ncbi:peptidase M23 [Hahella sp. CCB-MM4]|uniref:OapA family protein n=1 Tax=Hahella sp. (strain CCB-MM4) TaxID=1926491 RepID=UPI000BD3C8D7|nr:peptidoglycan DD-metalloendopeptidase family protein [Hahella sp. CCB-MM4]OZG70033.1 peptidase M23 [Hahella sp. CCB-MM4]